VHIILYLNKFGTANLNENFIINTVLPDVEIEEVSVAATNRKDQPINPMANISARSFTVEETEKYAGSWGDPARMTSNYAGVFPAEYSNEFQHWYDGNTQQIEMRYQQGSFVTFYYRIHF